MLAAFGPAAAGLYFHAPAYAATKEKEAAPGALYVCPMNPKVTSAAPADCPECGMNLGALSGDKPVANEPHKGGCCAEKPVEVEPPPAASCPHLPAQAAQSATATHTDFCCPKPANP